MKYNLINLHFSDKKSYLPEYDFKPIILKSKISHGYWILSTEDSDTSIRYTMFNNDTYEVFQGVSKVIPYITTVIEVSEDKFNTMLQKELIVRSLEA